MNFAVCLDANKGKREAARQRDREKKFAFANEGLKFNNREMIYEKTLDNNVIGFSRTLSDAVVAAKYNQGKGRQEVETAAKIYFSKKKSDGGGRSTRYGLNDYKALLGKKAQVEGIDRTNFTRNIAYAQTGAIRQYQTANAKAKEALGVPPQFGMPTMLPPKDYFTGTLQLLQTGLSIATSFQGLTTPNTPPVVNNNYYFA